MPTGTHWGRGGLQLFAKENELRFAVWTSLGPELQDLTDLISCHFFLYVTYTENPVVRDCGGVILQAPLIQELMPNRNLKTTKTAGFGGIGL